MDQSLTQAQQEIREAVLKVCARFGDDYWLERDREGGFPLEFHRAFAEAGWLGIAMPEAYGGAGLGITEAAVMMQAVAESGAALSGASAVHMNIFGLNPVVVFGTEEQKRRFLPPLIAGTEKGFYWSTNGSEWTQAVPSNAPIRVNKIVRYNKQRLFAATSEGVFTSRDAGKSWYRLAGSDNRTVDIAVGMLGDKRLVLVRVFPGQDREARQHAMTEGIEARGLVAGIGHERHR
jgi:hypothetical protein